MDGSQGVDARAAGVRGLEVLSATGERSWLGTALSDARFRPTLLPFAVADRAFRCNTRPDSPGRYLVANFEFGEIVREEVSK